MWQVLIALSATLWATHVALLKMVGDRLPSAQVTFLFYLAAVGTTGLILLVSRSRIDVPGLMAQPKLLWLLGGAGASIALVDFFFVKAFSLGGPVSLALPLFAVIGIALSALIGVFYFAEALTAMKVFGIALCSIGLFLLVR